MVERQEKPIWATPTIDITPERTQVVVAGGDYDRGLDPRTGAELWRFAANGWVDGTPAADEKAGVVYAPCRDGSVYAIGHIGDGEIDIVHSCKDVGIERVEADCDPLQSGLRQSPGFTLQQRPVRGEC